MSSSICLYLPQATRRLDKSEMSDVPPPASDSDSSSRVTRIVRFANYDRYSQLAEARTTRSSDRRLFLDLDVFVRWERAHPDIRDRVLDNTRADAH